MRKLNEKRKPGRPRTLGPTVEVNVRVPAELFAALMTEAAERRLNASECFRAILAERYVSRV
jgi:hypothetical protein